MRSNKEQTAQFKLRDVTLFKEDKTGKVRMIPCTTTDNKTLAATGTTLKLDNMKTGWKRVSIYHNKNEDSYFCPVKALAYWFVRVHRHSGGRLGCNTILSTYSEDGICYNLKDKDIQEHLK